MGNDKHSKALDILRRGGVIRQNNDMFRVQGNSGDWTVAVWDDKHIQCSCPVNKIRRQECHHIMAVKNYLISARTGWSMW